MSRTKEIIETSKSFEEKMMTRDKRSKKVAWGIATVMISFSILCIVAIIIMLPLKKTDVELYTVDSHTGRIEYVSRVNKANISAEEAMAKSFVANYVTLREGYNYFALQHDYDTIQLFNSDAVNTEYLTWFDNENSPDIHQNAANVITTEIISNVISPATKPDMLANVRIKRTSRHIADGRMNTEYWNIRMTYRYVADKELTDSQRESNPLGFIVTSYQRDKELRKE